MNHQARRGMALFLALALAAAGRLAAQTTPAQELTLPPEVAEEMVALYNGEETIRLTAPAHVAAGSEILGDVVVLGGPVRIAGTVRGRVGVINGELRLEPGAHVLGDVLVVGGTAVVAETALVEGSIRTFREPMRFRIEAGRLALAQPPAEPEFSAGRDFGVVRTDLTFASRRGYNRVEGLPIVVGPRFETRLTNPTRAEALLVYRTESGADVSLSGLGYLLRLEQFMGGRQTVRVGATLHSEITPIEDWGLSDTENSLSTFLFQRDYRDHYEREGWSAYLRVAPPELPYDLLVEYRDERHSSVRAASPFSLSSSDDWRPQPRVAEGTLRSIGARVSYDTRNEGADPTAGWLLSAAVERALGGSLVLPADACPAEACTFAVPQDARTDFATATLDLRHYARLGPDSRLSIRTRVSTSLNDRPLPPQRQHALGGEGSLPGYHPFRFDCGAREGAAGDDGFFPYYGCDRLALVQIEYQSAFRPARGWGRKLGDDIDLGEVPGWVVFFDVGRAWTERVAREGRTGGQDDFAADFGAGLRFGRLGVYWAFPLSGSDRGVNFFVRLRPRI